MSRKIIALTVSLVAIFVELSSAQTAAILVNYGNSNAPVPTFGGQWNEITATNINLQPLVDADGVATSVTVSFGGNGWTPATTNQGNWNFGDLDWVAANASNDFIFINDGQSSTIIFDGLFANGLYRFDHLAVRDSSPDRIADYSINGSFGDSNPDGNRFDVVTNGWNPGNYLTWNSVQADANGQLILSVANASPFGYANASSLTLIAVPEPTSACVFIALGTATIFRRRKRKCVRNR